MHDIVDTAVADGRFTTLVAAVTAAELVVTASEPTMDVLMTFYCAPNGGGVVYQFPLGEEFVVQGNVTNDAFAIRVVTPAGVTPNCAAWAEWSSAAGADPFPAWPS